MLTAKRLREMFNYDRETGVFFRLPREAKTQKDRTYNTRFANRPAGYICPRGFHEISVDNKIYRAHRLAWLYVHGEWPENEIDHINGNTSDNSLSNLRPATRQENARNIGRRSHNTSGLKGVIWFKQTKKWRAALTVNNQHHSLGYYDTREAAYEAYCREGRRLYGEFFRPE